MMRVVIRKFGTTLVVSVYLMLAVGSVAHDHLGGALVTSSGVFLTSEMSDSSPGVGTLRAGHVCAMCTSVLHAGLAPSYSAVPPPELVSSTSHPAPFAHASRFTFSLSRRGPPVHAV